MGVCLEPEACFLRHTVMNTKAKEFIPGQYKAALGAAAASMAPDAKSAADAANMLAS